MQILSDIFNDFDVLIYGCVFVLAAWAIGSSWYNLLNELWFSHCFNGLDNGRIACVSRGNVCVFLDLSKSSVNTLRRMISKQQCEVLYRDGEIDFISSFELQQAPSRIVSINSSPKFALFIHTPWQISADQSTTGNVLITRLSHNSYRIYL